MNLTPVVAAVAHVPAYVPPPIQRPPARSAPSAATAAGVLWIIFGIARLCNLVYDLFSLREIPKEAAWLVVLFIALHLSIALLFLNAGINTARGKAHDFGGYMLLSLFFGLLGIAYTVVLVSTDQLPLNGEFLLMMGFSVLLLTASLLANGSRQAYRDWKAGKPAAPRARRARRARRK